MDGQYTENAQSDPATWTPGTLKFVVIGDKNVERLAQIHSNDPEPVVWISGAAGLRGLHHVVKEVLQDVVGKYSAFNAELIVYPSPVSIAELDIARSDPDLLYDMVVDVIEAVVLFNLMYKSQCSLAFAETFFTANNRTSDWSIYQYNAVARLVNSQFLQAHTISLWAFGVKPTTTINPKTNIQIKDLNYSIEPSFYVSLYDNLLAFEKLNMFKMVLCGYMKRGMVDPAKKFPMPMALTYSGKSVQLPQPKITLNCSYSEVFKRRAKKVIQYGKRLDPAKNLPRPAFSLACLNESQATVQYPTKDAVASAKNAVAFAKDGVASDQIKESLAAEKNNKAFNEPKFTKETTAAKSTKEVLADTNKTKSDSQVTVKIKRSAPAPVGKPYIDCI